MTEKKHLSPEEWEKISGITIIDPDGWRGCGKLKSQDYNKKITKKEFVDRLLPSTIKISNKGMKFLEEDE